MYTPFAHVITVAYLSDTIQSSADEISKNVATVPPLHIMSTKSICQKYIRASKIFIVFLRFHEKRLPLWVQHLRHGCLQCHKRYCVLFKKEH